jgi:hypothetical protein
MSSIIRATTSSGLQVAPDNSGILELQTNGTTTAVTIDASQNVSFVGNIGMGTTSPIGAGLVLNAQGNTATPYSSIVAGSPSNANFVSFYSGQTIDPNPSIVFNNSLRFGTATSPNTSGYTERMRIDSSGNLLFNSGYGSVATAYGCRAWVNFNGTGTVAIRDSGNVSSITDGGTGLYTVNFTTEMPDANYAVADSFSGTTQTGNSDATGGAMNYLTTSFQIYTRNGSNTASDRFYVSCSVFR